jgi:hypothetical protein
VSDGEPWVYINDISKYNEKAQLADLANVELLYECKIIMKRSPLYEMQEVLQFLQ